MFADQMSIRYTTDDIQTLTEKVVFAVWRKEKAEKINREQKNCYC